MRLWILAVLLMSACGPVVANNTTRCGLGIENGSNGWFDMAQLQEAEDALLAHIGAVQDSRINDPERTCRLLSYGYVYAKDETDWVDAWGRQVAGITFCENRLMIIGRGFNGDWRSSSVIHEMTHWVQRCVGSSPNREADYANDDGHRNWHADGIYPMIELTRKGP